MFAHAHTRLLPSSERFQRQISVSSAASNYSMHECMCVFCQSVCCSLLTLSPALPVPSLSVRLGFLLPINSLQSPVQLVISNPSPPHPTPPRSLLPPLPPLSSIAACVEINSRIRSRSLISDFNEFNVAKLLMCNDCDYMLISVCTICAAVPPG